LREAALDSITCPGCKTSVRVPADVLGKRAQCPFCHCHFRVPVRVADGSLAAPTLVRRNPFVESRTFGPGVLLMLVGLLASLTSTVDIARSLADPEEFAARTREYFDQIAEQRKSPELREFGETTVKWLPVARFGFLALGLLTTAGGIAMVRERYHSLAMLGSLAALFNMYYCSCILGFPIGGWALFTLMDPQVRLQFQKRLSSNPS
jgi:hypothetical protein